MPVRTRDTIADWVTSHADTVVNRAQSASQSAQQTAAELASQARHLSHDGAKLAQPYVRSAHLGLWNGIQALVAVAIAVPRLLSRALAVARVLTERAEVAADRGQQVADRAREIAHSVAPSRRDRRAARFRVTIAVAAGFAVGFVVGWIVADARGLAAQERDRNATQAHADEIARRDAGVSPATATATDSAAPAQGREGSNVRVTVIEGGGSATRG